MKYTFLDAGFDVGLGDVILVLLAIPLAIILLEAFVMKLLTFNSSFGKCFLDSFLANLATFLIGYLLVEAGFNVSIGGGDIPAIAIAFVLSIVVEGLILLALNQKKPGKQIWKTSLIMNLVSYIGLILVALIATI